MFLIQLDIRSHLISKLADVCRSYNGNDLVSVTERMCQLEDLGFIRDRTERTAYHTHAAGNTFVIQDLCTALLVASDGFYSACLLAGTGVVGNCAFGAGLHTWMGYTASAHVTDNIPVRRAGGTGRREERQEEK